MTISILSARHGLADFVGLAAADEIGGIGTDERLAVIVVTGSAPAERASSCQFFEAGGKSPAEIDTDQAARMVLSAGGTSSHRRLLSFRFEVEVDGAGRDDGGNGVLVDHLGHGVTQQDDVLVERLDMALQLDAVDQVDRDRDVLFAQGIEEWVL
jgi:hypothetical protein